ncbi:MAG: alpha/beta fold hydrolase [Acidimicrobiales bacterium]
MATATSEPIAAGEEPVRPPRLVRRRIRLANGHRVGVAAAGRGIPLVVVHGYLAEGFLYAQILSRLVAQGFMVVAVDTAGFGGTQGLPARGGNLALYTKLLGQTLDELGIERAVFAGHSMGGRIVTELAASEPERALAVLSIDGIVGDPWDRLVDVFRLMPPLLIPYGVVLLTDTMWTVPLLRDPGQARKLGRLALPTLAAHVYRPWRLVGPAISVLRSRGSRWMLEGIAQKRIPFVAIHGDRDLPVPFATGRSAAQRAKGELVVVEHGTHSWLLRDPETLPAIVSELMAGRMGKAIRRELRAFGLDPDRARPDEMAAAFCSPGATVLAMTPSATADPVSVVYRPPRYRWHVEHRK